MNRKHVVSWFLTETGRTFSFGCICALGIGFTSTKYLPHTIFLEKYKEFVYNYKNGQKVELSAELEKKFNECIDILKFSDLQKKYIKPFPVFGLDLFHAGSTSSRFGAVVGIPVNFTYKSLEDIDKENLQVNLKQVDWSSEIGQQLANALILPEEVQKFALCREILATNNNKIIFDGAYPVLVVTLIYALSQYINRRLRLYEGPPALRGILYCLVGMFGTGFYFLMKDLTEIQYETAVDKQLAELGPEFVQSGTVFYDKMLNRNKALRELMGNEGQNKYSVLGNENFFLRHRRIPLMHRKAFFENKLNGDNEEKTE